MNVIVRSTRCIALLLSLLAAQANALCSVPAAGTSPAGFGPVASMAVRTTVQSTSTTNAGLSCTGSLLTLLSSGDHFYGTFTSATSGMVGPTGDVIAYNLYASNNTGAAYLITRGTAYDFARNGIIDLLGLLGGTTPKTVPVYMGSIPGNVAAGIYSETLTVLWSWNYCSGIALLGACLGRDISSGTTTLTVNMTVTNDCAITAPNIAFNGAPLVSGFAEVNQTISIACTKGSAYTVGLGPGQNVNANGRRQMISGNNVLAYDIFKSAGSTVWGSVGAARRASSTAEINPGNGTGIPGAGSQVFNYNAKIYTDQSTPPVGVYADSVTLDVGF